MTDFIHESISEIENAQSEISVKTSENGRTYQFGDSHFYPSITTVLGHLKKHELMEWRKRVGEEEANRISRKAALNGTKVHNLIEKLLNNEHIDLSKETPLTALSFQAVDKVLREKVGTIYATECAMYSRYLGVAGRVDCIGMFDDRISVIDFKTSRRVKSKHEIENYFMQESAYAIMFEEMTGIPITNLVTIMAVNGHSKAEVFEEKRDRWVDRLQTAIQIFHNDKNFS